MTATPGVPEEVDLLTPYVQAGVFKPAEVQLTASVRRVCGPLPDDVLLAVAVAARGPRLGHVCIDLSDIEGLLVGETGDATGLAWTTTDQWSVALRADSAVASPQDAAVEPFRPLVFDGRRLYLQRYWGYEQSVADDVRSRAAGGADGPLPGLEPTLEAVFGREGDEDVESDRQRLAVRVAMENRVSVIAGGPGTGKTRTIARLLVVAHAMSDVAPRTLDVALAAPTGKAATRMTEALQLQLSLAETGGVLSTEQSDALRGSEAVTLHRLLGWAPGTQFRHNRDNPLPHDLVIVDETSMVPLQLMSRLLAAMKPDARLVLVGDPFQLASVEAGSVLEDMVGPALFEPTWRMPDAPLAGRVTVLTRMHRFAEDSTIAALAAAVRHGDADGAMLLLAASRDDVQWILPDEADKLAELRQRLTDAAVDVVRAALEGEAATALDSAIGLKVLAAVRRGEQGLDDWNDRIEAAVAERVPQLDRLARWYVGRPITVTANDYVNNVFNGDVGVVVAHHDGPRAAFRSGSEIRYLAPSRLDRVETWWAMTIHKSQGSEFTHAVVSLPSAASPILSRELLYTAVTRAITGLTIVATEAALRAAIAHPVARASGLRERLWPAEALARA